MLYRFVCNVSDKDCDGGVGECHGQEAEADGGHGEGECLEVELQQGLHIAAGEGGSRGREQRDQRGRVLENG